LLNFSRLFNIINDFQIGLSAIFDKKPIAEARIAKLLLENLKIYWGLQFAHAYTEAVFSFNSSGYFT